MLNNTTYVCVYILGILQALILMNTCNGYKLPQEFTVQDIQKPVLVVTKSTGEALSSLVREGLEARVEFGGTDEEGGGGWVVEGGVGNTLPLEVPQKPEWEDCTPRFVSHTAVDPLLKCCPN